MFFVVSRHGHISETIKMEKKDRIFSQKAKNRVIVRFIIDTFNRPFLLKIIEKHIHHISLSLWHGK